MISMGGDHPEMLLLKAVEEVNERQKGLLVEKVKRHFGANLSGLTFAVWGLAFKPRTDDMRDAPAITVIESLLDAGAGCRPSIRRRWKRREKSSAIAFNILIATTTRFTAPRRCSF